MQNLRPYVHIDSPMMLDTEYENVHTVFGMIADVIAEDLAADSLLYSSGCEKSGEAAHTGCRDWFRYCRERCPGYDSGCCHLWH